MAPNRLKRRFDTCIPHQKITTDTTEFKYYQLDEQGHLVTKKLYLDPFLDLYNREIISYSITKRPCAEGIANALNKAIQITSDCKYRRTFIPIKLGLPDGMLYQTIKRRENFSEYVSERDVPGQ